MGASFDRSDGGEAGTKTAFHAQAVTKRCAVRELPARCVVRVASCVACDACPPRASCRDSHTPTPAFTISPSVIVLFVYLYFLFYIKIVQI